MTAAFQYSSCFGYFVNVDMVSGRIFHAEHFPSVWADKGLHGDFQRADIFDALVECVKSST